MGNRRTSSSGRSRRQKRKYFGPKPAAAEVDDVVEVPEVASDVEVTEKSASTRKLSRKPAYLADESFDSSDGSDVNSNPDSKTA